MFENPWGKVQLNTKGDTCTCVEGSSQPLCTLDDLSTALELGRNQKDYEWILGYNEPWDTMSVEFAAQVWG